MDQYPLKLEIEALLKKHWGYGQLRAHQIPIITAILSNKSCFATLATGGGKSLCYQIPALYFSGVTLVISPLIALMNDQVKALKRKGVRAAALHSGLSKREQDITIDNFIYGGIKILYLSPERLANTLFLARLEKMDIAFVAIDEAHCISQWGHDFRPAYRLIKAFVDKLENVPVLALTATATPYVISDILENLNLSQAEQFIGSPKRDNLSYQVIHVESKKPVILESVSKMEGSKIIYVRSRKGTKELKSFLDKRNITAAAYHGGMDTKEKMKAQDAWIDDKKKVMVATNAFGMGIDKANVRQVIHHDLPSSLEEYVQEAGRAGRDGSPAVASIMYQKEDINTKKKEIEKSFPPIQLIRTIYRLIGIQLQLAVGSALEQFEAIDIEAIANKADCTIAQVYYACKYLSKSNYLSLSDGFFNASVLKLHPMSSMEMDTIQADIQDFIKSLLRRYEGLFLEFVKIDESQISKKLNMKPNVVIALLHQINIRGLGHYKMKSKGMMVCFHQARVKSDDLEIPKEFYEHQLKLSLKRLEYMGSYLETTSCRQDFISSYFGFNNEGDCGKCDNCISKQNGSDLEDEKYLEAKILADVNLEDRELLSYIQSYSKDVQSIVKSIVQRLESEHLIYLDYGILKAR